MAGRTRDFFERNQWPLLVQGEGMSRRKMVESFKVEVGSVLFGTESFWSGVDVPGEALSNVIITQLPFAPPDSPATEARCELIKERGGDPFSEYSLPEAILKLRQGVGRLIRTRSDRGIVLVLDHRVVTKSYGKTFLRSLPPVGVVQDATEQVLERAGVVPETDEDEKLSVFREFVNSLDVDLDPWEGSTGGSGIEGGSEGRPD